MNPIVTLGNSCIGLSLGLCLFGMISFLMARRINSALAASLGRGTLYANFILMTVANLAMIYALLGDDFSVSYVAHVGSIETPRLISAISLWSSLEGSILFWGWILSAYAAVCTYLYRERTEKIWPWVGLTLLFVETFFFFLLSLPANPFLLTSPVPVNGPGPNPLLQNHWLMAIHPPCLYIGYIGFTVPFAFAVASLLEAEGHWLVFARRWILFAWSFLSMAIVLGGWWSYAVLGWGGYWAWDPVENASFMPWLTATALVHSLMVQEKRKMLPVWNLALAMVTFLLTLLGTFLTRSGVLDSVHSFTESHVGPYFLVFIGITLAISLALLLWKSPRLKHPGRFEGLLSLEVLLLFNNLLFLSFCFVVFLGTLYPLIIEAIRGTRLSVGEPYFNQMTVPIIGMILFLMGVGLITPWKKTNLSHLLSVAKLPAVLAVVVTLISFIGGGRNPWVVLIFLLASFAFLVMGIEFCRHTWQQSGKNPIQLLKSAGQVFMGQSRRYSGFIAHTGALMIIVAVTISSNYEKDQEFTLKQGQSVQMKDNTLTFEGIQATDTPQRFEVKALILVTRKGKILTHLFPQMNFYPSSQQPIGSPAVCSTLIEDLYITLIHFEKNGSEISLRVITTPAVAWIWIGGVVIMLGGLLALSLDRPQNIKDITKAS